MMFNAGAVRFGGIACALLLLAGCGKANLEDMVDQGMKQVSDGMEGVKDNVQDLRSDVGQQVKQQLNKTQDAVNQQVGRAGSMTLQLRPPLEVNACFARFIRFQDGRPSVVQFQSYRDAESETFPSVFIRAITQVASPAELNGVTLEASMFVQREEGGPVLHTSSPLQLQIVQVDDQQVVAKILGGSLDTTDGKDTVSVTGQLEGKFER